MSIETVKLYSVQKANVCVIKLPKIKGIKFYTLEPTLHQITHSVKEAHEARKQVSNLPISPCLERSTANLQVCCGGAWEAEGKGTLKWEHLSQESFHTGGVLTLVNACPNRVSKAFRLRWGPLQQGLFCAFLPSQYKVIKT